MRYAPGYTLALLCLGTACSGDYTFTPPDENAQPLIDLEVTPRTVSREGACSAFVEEVTLENVGTRAVTLERIVTTGESWNVQAGWPSTLEPGASATLQLTGVGGDGTLVITSDDTAEPTIEIPLLGTLNSPPSVVILEPDPDSVLELDNVSLVAKISDDLDPPEALQIQWNSSIDGALDDTPADTNGDLSYLWAAPRSPGDHVLTLDVADSCGSVGATSVNICQEKTVVSDALEIEDWTFAGAARWDTKNDWLELTGLNPNQVGSAFATQETVYGGELDIEFLFYVGDGTGADGFSLTMLDASRSEGTLGGTGCGMGYGGDSACTDGPALPGWTVEVDTYYNEGHDPTEEDHIAFVLDGQVDRPEAWVAAPELEDTGWHFMRVVVQAPNVKVYIDGTEYLNIYVAGNFAFDGWVGFTAGTGDITNNHLIYDLTVTESRCE